LFKEQILENENRRKIYSIIKLNPGIHLRELQRTLNVPLSTLNYHINYMIRKKIIFSEKKEPAIGFYVKAFDDEDKQILSVLRQKRLREIVYLVLTNKKVKIKVLRDKLNLPRSTLSYYLKFLVEHGILEKEKIGYENIYTIIDENRITKILITYKSSLIDKLVDKTLNTWLETRFRK